MTLALAGGEGGMPPIMPVPIEWRLTEPAPVLIASALKPALSLR